MSQLEVYKILLEYGGSATTDQIAKVLATRFPDLGLHIYVRRTLKRMEHQGYIQRMNSNTWVIIRQNRPSWAKNLFVGEKGT